MAETGTRTPITQSTMNTVFVVPCALPSRHVLTASIPALTGFPLQTIVWQCFLFCFGRGAVLLKNEIPVSSEPLKL